MNHTVLWLVIRMITAWPTVSRAPVTTAGAVAPISLDPRGVGSLAVSLARGRQRIIGAGQFGDVGSLEA